MNNLPVEILVEIFDHLNLENKLKCRQVSKTFLSVLDSFMTNKQLFITSQLISVRKYNTRNKRVIDHKNFIFMNKKIDPEVPCFFDLSFLLKNRYFKNIKKLFILLNGEIDLDLLNNFKQLKSLDLEAKVHNTKPALLVLPNLEKLTLVKTQATLSSQNLKFLQFINFEDTIHCDFSDCLENVEEMVIDIRSIPSKFKISKFKRLKYLKSDITIMRYSHVIDQLFELPEFKILNLVSHRFDEKNLNTKFRSKEVFNAYQNYCSKIYWNGVPLDKYVNQYYELIKGLEFENADILNDVLLDFYLANYSSIPNSIDNIRSINFNSCQSYFQNNKVPNAFLGKLADLTIIKVFKKVDKKTFVNFLFACKTIDKLKLTYSSLDQDFYSNLNRYIPWLHHIKIKDDEKVLNAIDFSFLDGFKFLRKFKIEHPINLKFIKKLIREIQDYKLVFLTLPEVEKKRLMFTYVWELISAHREPHLSVHHPTGLKFYAKEDLESSTEKTINSSGFHQATKGMKFAELRDFEIINKF